MLDAVRRMAPLRDPYPKRDAHGGPDDAWKPSNIKNDEWVIVGTRSGKALNPGQQDVKEQDVYDEAAADAAGVATWIAAAAEVNGRAPEEIVRTRQSAARQAEGAGTKD